ncbi:MAG: hypothetical protein O7C66_01605, partial [Alphaproteobacteria bacterium]|nr:hypothetical protein [Alphaproteobacteria bacterium]
YQLENTGDGPMVFLGTRTGPNSANQHINYDTREDMRETRRARPAGEGYIKPSDDSVRSK